MTAAQHTTNGPAPRTARTNDTARFLSAIFRGQEHGYVHLGYIAGDPERDKDTDAGALQYAGWYKASDRDGIQRKVDELGRTYGDTYIRRTAFAHKDYRDAHALPSVAIFIDDATHHLDSASMLVQTSEQSYQAWYLLDEPAAPNVVRELQTLGKLATGGDNCHSVDHFVRMPGMTYNTKHGGHFRVRITRDIKRRYTVDELRALFLSWQPSQPPTGPRRSSSTGYSWTIADVEKFTKQHSDRLDYYGEHFAALLSTTDGVQHPKSFKAHATHQGYKVCAGTLKIMNAAGTDLDYSDIRAAFIKSCVLARYDDAATYLLTLHFCQYRDTPEQTKIDTVRYLARVRGELPHITPWPRSCGKQQQPQAVAPVAAPPPAVKRPRGRPTGLDSEHFYAELLELAQHDADGEPIVLMTQQELAAQMHISRRKVAALEAQNRAANRIGARHPIDKHHRSYLALTPLQDAVLPHAINHADPMQQISDAPDAQSDVYSIAMPETENDAVCAYKGTYTPFCTAPDTAPQQLGGYVPCDAAASPVPSDDLADWLEPEQLSALPEIKRKRPRIKLDTLTPPEQLVELKRRLGRAQHAASRAEWIGHTSQRRAITKHIRALREQIAALEARSAAAVVPESPLPSLFAWLDTPAGMAQEPPTVPRVPMHRPSASPEVLRWRAALEARIADSETDQELETLAMSFANSFMWESAFNRIAQMHDRVWAYELHGVVRDMLRLTGLPGYDPRIPGPIPPNVPSGAT